MVTKYFIEQLVIFDLLIQSDSFLVMQNFSKSFTWKKNPTLSSCKIMLLIVLELMNLFTHLEIIKNGKVWWKESFALYKIWWLDY